LYAFLNLAMIDVYGEAIYINQHYEAAE